MKKLRVGSLIPLLLCICSIALKGQDTSEEYWQPIEPYRISINASDVGAHELIKRWNEIGYELDTSKNRFAGTYEKRGYRGYFLRWSPAKGFVYVFHSEGLSIIDFSYGKVQETPDAIVFLPEREMKETFRGRRLITPREWISITAGKEAFLVPKQELRSFGRYVAGFDEYNDFNGPCCEFSPFFTKTENLPKASLTSTVSVAQRYQSAIKRPITARIVFVEERKVVTNYGLEGRLYSQLFPRASLLPVTINAGRNVGVRNNMLFKLVDQPGEQYLKITQTAKNRALGVVIRNVDENNKEVWHDGSKETPFPPIKIGTRVTTSPILEP
jgi:hypothetical protein